MRRPLIHGLCHILALGLARSIMGQNAGLPMNLPARLATVPIPFDQIGTVAGRQCSGDGLSVEFSPDRARLRCSFQQLNGEVSTEGVCFASTPDGTKGEGLLVIPRSGARQSAEALPLDAHEVRVGTV